MVRQVSRNSRDRITNRRPHQVVLVARYVAGANSGVQVAVSDDHGTDAEMSANFVIVDRRPELVSVLKLPAVGVAQQSYQKPGLFFIRVRISLCGLEECDDRPLSTTAPPHNTAKLLQRRISSVEHPASEIPDEFGPCIDVRKR